MSTVLVSGATGFIAQHIIHQLLQKGYEVIGTVRNEEKASRLLSLFQDDRLSLEVVASLSDPGAFDHIFIKHGDRIKYVIHTASPCHYSSTDHEADMLIPAINGTKSLLDSIKRHGSASVEHVVYTSSFAAVSNVASAYDEKLVLNEESWNNDSWETAKENAKTAYYGSKALAEKAAWEFLQQNRDSVRFGLTTVNPCYVFGPQLFDESISNTLNASCQNINEIVLSNTGDEVDQTFASLFIDVRDVAKAHLLAIEVPALTGKRLLLANTKFAMQDIVDTINKQFPALNGRIAVGVPGNGAEVVKHIATLDNSQSKKLLGFEFKGLEETVYDTVSQILRAKDVQVRKD